MKPSFLQKLLATTAVLGLMLSLGVRAQETVIHLPRLNWDFFNFTGQQANDFAIIVESANYNPNEFVVGMPFPNLTVTHGDYLPWHAGNETKIEWSGAVVNPNGTAHIGLDMVGAGRILDAYWTLNGAKIGLSLAISYELTEIRLGNSGAIHMDLQIAPGWFLDHSGGQAGWENVRTFVNIPSSQLGLQDINLSLDLSTLSAFEVTPHQGVPGFPGDSGLNLPGQILMPNGDSFFDVFLAVTGDQYLNGNFESLLVADVLNQGQVIGRFWNINYECPEPSSVMFLVLGGIALSLRLLQRQKTRS